MALDFTSSHTRALSTAVHIFGASILAFCFAARIQSTRLSLETWRHIPWARLSTILVFLDSWLFHVWASLLIQGYGLDLNTVTCRMGIYLCIVVYVVWPHAGTRLSSKAFCVCMFMMAGYALVAFDMLIGRNTFIEKADCVIGLKSFAMFLWPLQQAHFRDVRLRKIASRTLWAALVALTTSSINIAVLTIEHGVELGWICLASCGLDVTINALVIFAVTGYKPDDNVHMYCSTMNFSVAVTSQAFSRHLSGSDHSSPGPCLPPPVQSKDKVYRTPIGMFSDSRFEPYNDLLEKQDDFEVTSSIPPLQASSAYRFACTDCPQVHSELMENEKAKEAL